MTDAKSATPMSSEKAPRMTIRKVHVDAHVFSAPVVGKVVPADFAYLLYGELNQALSDLAEKNKEIERLTKELRIAELKNRGTLANNLCPDHRDKQVGKPCLACEIERLRNYADHKDGCGWRDNNFGQPCTCGLSK